jgi:hypothetical protein
MYAAFIITFILVISVISFLISIGRRKKSMISMELFSFKFKYVGGALVIISIFLSFFELMEEELYTNLRIIIANLGLIIIALSKDKLEVKDCNFVKMVCFSLSTFIFYLVNHLMIIFYGVEKIIELPLFIMYLLIMYLISYHSFKSKLTKGV